MFIGKQPDARRSARHARSLLTVLLGAALLAGCGNGSSGGGGQSGITGTEVVKPGSAETFFVDDNESGKTRRLRLVEVTWGRLVNVHALDAPLSMGGETLAVPEFRNFLIGQQIQTDVVDYRLESNPVTHQARLVILRERDDPEFRTLLDQAAGATQSVEPKHDDGTSIGPFPFIPRNCTLSLRFNDVLSDGVVESANLAENVKVLTDYPPSIPFQSRNVFDPNHGAVVGGAFHSTRVLVDLTISATEAAGMIVPLPVNAIGLAASSQVTKDPNVSIHVPSKVVTSQGQFSRLTSLSGAALDPTDNGPVANNATLDIVRAFRGGNSSDTNNGFLRDLEAPEVLGAWPVTAVAAADDGAGELGFDFLLDVNFPTACQDRLDEEDVLEIGPHFLAVSELTAAPDGSGTIVGVKVRNLSEAPISVLATLLGGGELLSTYDLASPVPVGCWITFTPSPVTPPTTGVSTTAVASVRFTEPMDPSFLTALDTFSIIRGAATAATTAENIVVGIVLAGPDLDSFAFTQTLPFSHTMGMSEKFHVVFNKFPKDLAGNPLVAKPPKIEFAIDANDPTAVSGGITFRFDSIDEMGFEAAADAFTGKPDGRIDLRGQLFYDSATGVLRPRSVSFATYTADRTQTIPGLMTPAVFGVQDPLVPLGSKVQTLWRYCDFGWASGDETKYNLDILGLAWAPVGGNVLGDFFEDFEIALSHSTRLPDETVNAMGFPQEPASGLFGSPNLFDDNVLDDVDSRVKVVHPRSLGYQISAIDLFSAPTGTTMMPFPLNRSGAPRSTFLWRDTGSAGASTSAINIGGIPLNIEVANGIGSFETTIVTAVPIPTIALPLLMEFRCFPSSTGVGLNALDVSIANALSTAPNFRAYSSGGANTSGKPVKKNPDQEFVPSGGFNPFSLPPGQPTTTDADNVFYLGSIDTVVRVSRGLTCWIDTKSGVLGSNYLSPVIEPDPRFFPEGTSVLLEFRGADDFSGSAAQPNYIPFDAASMDWYGDIRRIKVGGPGGIIEFFNDDLTWYREISKLNGARYLQTRISFFNNVDSRQTAELSAIGIAFIKNN